jgi:hypothetical protein
MEQISGRQTAPEVSASDQTSADLIKRIRKLRWIGLEQEAQRAQTALCRITPTGSVLTLPCDTD